MAFWGGQGNAMVDPKRSFRWLVTFGTKHNKLHDWYAKSANKPSFTVGETPHRFVNHTFFYPGRVEWQTIDIVLVDPARENDSSLALMQSLQESGYYNPTDPLSATSTITKRNAVKALGGQIFLKQLGQDRNDIVETWTLINPWIKDIKFGDLNYESEDMVEITLTVRYDFATLTAGVPTKTASTPKK
tara:strand:+ start:8457 stop:9020 length:564 start_codon:yes stop_codon:yes gene_type:complete